MFHKLSPTFLVKLMRKSKTALAGMLSCLLPPAECLLSFAGRECLLLARGTDVSSVNGLCCHFKLSRARCASHGAGFSEFKRRPKKVSEEKDAGRVKCVNGRVHFLAEAFGMNLRRPTLNRTVGGVQRSASPTMPFFSLTISNSRGVTAISKYPLSRSG